MKMENTLIYLRETYHPLTVILYGSYADGTATDTSDFDALLLVSDAETLVSDSEPHHDTAMVGGVQLDVWVYPAAAFQREFDPEEILQIYDGIVLDDTQGLGEALVAQVRAYVAAQPLPTREDVREALSWCRKMLARAANTDAEGLYRHHWLLSDSLQVAADVLGYRYFGPKKTLRLLRQAHPDLYDVYTDALREFDLSMTRRWIEALEAYADSM